MSQTIPEKPRQYLDIGLFKKMATKSSFIPEQNRIKNINTFRMYWLGKTALHTSFIGYSLSYLFLRKVKWWKLTTDYMIFLHGTFWYLLGIFICKVNQNKYIVQEYDKHRDVLLQNWDEVMRQIQNVRITKKMLLANTNLKEEDVVINSVTYYKIKGKNQNDGNGKNMEGQL